MRPAGIVIEPPRFNDPPRHRQAVEYVLVEAFIAKAATEALGKSVLDRLARGDVVPADDLTEHTLILPWPDQFAHKMQTLRS